MHALLRTIAALALLLAASLPMPTVAQGIGTEFSYQGELRDTGTPISGNIDFEFRLFDAATNGNQLGPQRALNGHPLSNGVFTVTLDFGDQFTGAQRWLEIGVRRSGQPTFTVLQPRQSIKATPYALHAEFIADNSIDGASIADGSITSVDLANNSVNSLQIVNGAVGTLELADASVTTPKIAEAAVTASKLAVGAVGIDQINIGQVQQRVTARCPVVLPMIGINSDGTPVCGNVSALISAGQAREPKVALREDGRPVIAFIDGALGDLILVSCGDAVCATHTTETLDANVGNSQGSLDVVVRGSGLPFVVYRDVAADALHAFDCTDETCAQRNFRTLDTTAGAGSSVSAVVRSDDTVFAAYRVGSAEIRAYDCANPACASGVVRSLVTSDVDGSSTVATVLALGDRSAVFYEGTNAADGLNVYNCLDADCSGGGRTGLIGFLDVVQISAVGRSTAPQVAFRALVGGMSVFTCSGTLGLCPGGTSQQVFPLTDLTGSPGVDIALNAADESPYVVTFANDQLAVRDCTTPDCSNGFTRRPDPIEGRGNDPSIAMRADNRPVIAYEDGNNIRITVCGNVGCAP
jgi:hypothetical protein